MFRLLNLALAVSLSTEAAAFHTGIKIFSEDLACLSKLCMKDGRQSDESFVNDNSISYGRRGLLKKMTGAIPSAFVIPFATFSSSDTASAATDPLFAPNPLTNPILEKFRIWDQDYADNIKFGGELAPGSPKGRDSYAKLLAPILTIESDLQLVDELVHLPNGEGLTKAALILDQQKFTKIAFKKTFNAFADNIYYSDPDRANLYLGGGATPKNEQSIAYLLRNDILTNVENLQAEVTYLIKVQQKNDLGEEKESFEDLFEYVGNARKAMGKYLELVPPGELKMSRSMLTQA